MESHGEREDQEDLKDLEDRGDEQGGADEPAPASEGGFRAWLRGGPLSPTWHLGLGLVMPLALLIVNVLRVRSYTVDDAYISYRYARNLARGLGLVFNEGERIEGYTNFLWTVILAGGIRIGLDPEVLAKALGGAAACGVLAVAYALERRLLLLRGVPCVSTWLLASSITLTGYSMFGLETVFFVFLVLAGTELMFREVDRGSGFPASGLVFALAGLTRPEAPMFVGIPMLFLGLRFFSRQNLLRGALFVAPVALHMLWRHSYYGNWLPNTLSAKTGDLKGQISYGFKYIGDYLVSQPRWLLSPHGHALPVLLIAVFGLCFAIVTLHRRALCLAVTAFAVLGYVVLVGGDWMAYFRFITPFEPYAFVVAGMGARAALDWLHAWAAWRISSGGVASRALAYTVSLAVVAGIIAIGVHRGRGLWRAQGYILNHEKRFWDSTSGQVVSWFAEHGERGEIGVSDMGQIAYGTDYPILDLLGLVDPVISKLPGGYTRKIGPGYVKRVFDKMPRYFVLIGNADGCDKLPFPGQERLRRDRRFQRAYTVAGKIRHEFGGYWCIFERHDGAPGGH